MGIFVLVELLMGITIGAVTFVVGNKIVEKVKVR